ncbi:MAG: glycosyltransferase [Pseudomonadota bacterium]|nr:glycosyltransferase [Pseudomonadota bacterium]
MPKKLYHSPVSVVIPTFNRCSTLPRAIDSVLAQTNPPEEVIVVDNGSTDSTIQMLQLNYPSISLIREAKPGVSAARNKGIMYATSDWVAFLDSDDAWFNSKLEKQLKTHTDSPHLRLIHTNETWYRNGQLVNQKKKHTKSGGDIFFKCLPICCISPSSVLIKRTLFDDVGLFDENLPVCEDYDFWLRVTAFESVLYVDEPLTIKYGGHHDQLSTKYWGMDRYRVQSLEKLLLADTLQREQAFSTKMTLIEKLNILVNGAEKRNHIDLAEYYGRKLSKWQNDIC